MNATKTITIAEIRSFNPCYDPNKYLPESYNDSLTALLENKEIPPKDRLWVVVRNSLMTQLQLKYYGLGCARLAEKFTTNPVIKACNDATELFLKGSINREELVKTRTAYAAAYAYAYADADAYAAGAAYTAAYAAYAAYAAAAAGAAAYAYAAAYAAGAANSAIAGQEMRENQCKLLIKVLETIE